MTIQARFVGAGVQPLVDAVKAAGGEPGDLRAVVWQATWARGYDDVVAPAPAIRLKEEGFVIFARSVGPERYAGIVDTGKALWALVARGVLPTLGSRVRIVPAFVDGELGWDVTILESLGLGLSIRFGARAKETGSWADLLRAALTRTAEVEAERRKAIVAERRSLVAIEPLKPFREEIDALHDEMRVRVEAESAATPEERAAFDKGNEKQRKAVIDECKTRRARRYQEELAVLRAQIPELQAAYDKRLAANTEARALVSELEDAGSRSRGVSERVSTVENQIAAVVSSGMLVGCDAERLEGLGAADFAEISRSVELLYDLTPRRTQKR